MMMMVVGVVINQSSAPLPTYCRVFRGIATYIHVITELINLVQHAPPCIAARSEALFSPAQISRG